MSEQSTEQKRRFPTAAIVGIILAVICGISLYIRIALPYEQVFVNGAVWFRETDAYYHMRNIENLLHHFPRFNSFDPYVLYPGGGGGLVRPFFDWLVAAVILLVSRGALTQHTIDVVGAYIPAILGTLALIPVYFVGKELFNRWIGVISAALLAILPGEFLNRSLLGFTDHHVAEALFSTVSMLFLIMAVRRAREKEISFGHFLRKDWSTIAKPLIYTLLAGIFLGVYLLCWEGGLLLVFIMFVFLVIQFLVDHLRHKSTDYLCLVSASSFLIAFLMLLPIMGNGGLDTIYRVSMLTAIVIPIVLSIISRLLAGRAMKLAYYPLALVVLAGIGIAALHAINPSLFHSMLSLFSVFTPSRAARTVLEIHALTFDVAWFNFTTSFIFSIVSLGLLIYAAIRERSAEKTLFLIWSITMLMALFAQRRWGYYFAINAALLTGYLCWRILDLAGLSRLLARSKEVVGVAKKFKKREKAKEQAKRKTFMQPRGVWASVIVVGIVIFFFVFFPNIGLWRETPTKIIGYTRPLAESSSIMEQGWYSSLLWLKDNSPEPFDAPDFYYELYPPRDSFEYPETAYGVMSWWDYGYFIMQIAHRIPNANPRQAGAVQAGQFFTAQNESSANELADKLGSKYVVIDYQMATSKFYAMPEWAGSSKEDFYNIYYQRTQSGELQPIALFYPTYYNSIVIRLYNFDGKAVTPTESTVISYEEKVSWIGVSYKEITSMKSFPSYEEAQAYVSSQESGNYKIAGTSLLVTPVPLEELKSYKLVHESDAKVTIADKSLPSVKIFEYLGSGEP